MSGTTGLLRIEDCLDADGGVALPSGVNMISLIERNIANVGDEVAYRYIDYARAPDGYVHELSWIQLGVRLEAIGARLQSLCARGERVAILAPQGLDYIAGFFGAIKAGNVAVPLFAPELQGHAERLETAFNDAEPAVVLTTAAALEAVNRFLTTLSRVPQIVVIDDIPDAEADGFVPVELDVDDVSHLQFTSGSTRPPVGVEITHRSVGTNLLQMILSIDLLDRNTHGVSWLPLYHDMGLSMIGFPAVYGGHSTLMSPTAFIRRPQRWIEALSDGARHGRVVTAAPNFAYEWTAQHGRPSSGDTIDLRNVVMIIGSEPVSMDAIETFNAAFAPHGLPRTAIKPSYGIAEATLLVSTIAPDAEATVIHLDRQQLTLGRAVRVEAQSPDGVAHVSCGQVARSLWAVIVDSDSGSDSGSDSEAGDELPDGQVGEVWLQGNNIGRGYWGRPDESRQVFDATLRTRLSSHSHADGAPHDGGWLRTGDLGVYLDGELYIAARIADLVTINGRDHYPHDIEATAARASPVVRKGYAAAFTVPGPAGEELVIVAERAAGTSRADPQQAIDAIRAAVTSRHGVSVNDVRLVPAGSIPRTTSGKLARRDCRSEYLAGVIA